MSKGGEEKWSVAGGGSDGGDAGTRTAFEDIRTGLVNAGDESGSRKW